MVIEVLNVLSSVFCLSLLFVVRTITVKGTEHTVLSWALFALFWWNTLAIAVHHTYDPVIVATLLPISCVGMIFFFPLQLHFSYVLWRKRSVSLSNAFFLYIPAAAAAVVNFFVPISLAVVPHSDGSFQLQPPIGTPLNTLWLLYAASCWLIPVVWYVQFYRSSSFNREKRQTRLLAWGMVLTFSIIVFEYLVAGSISSRHNATQSPLLISLWVGTMVYAIWRYGLLRVSPKLLAEEILDSLTDIVLLYDLEGKRVYTNKRAKSVLGLGGSPAALVRDPLAEPVAMAIGERRHWEPLTGAHNVRLHVAASRREAGAVWSSVADRYSMSLEIRSDYWLPARLYLPRLSSIRSCT